MRYPLNMILLCVCLGSLIICGCKNYKAHDRGGVLPPNKRDYYAAPKAPSMLKDVKEVNMFYANNFWSDFVFSDSAQISINDSVYIKRLLTDWILYLKEVPEIGPKCMEDVMSKALVSENTFKFFTTAIKNIISAPNSPLRDDELYIPVLKTMINSPYTDDVSRERYRQRLEVLSQNRKGHKANDFEYNLSDEHKGSLYAIKAEFTLVYIYDPDCDICSAIKVQLSTSTLLNDMIENGSLKLLAIYPYEDKNEWYQHRDEIPKTWINGYDKDCLIRSKGLYDVSAIPSLYLLDRDKIVLIKDSSNVEELESYLSNVETL